MTAAPVVEISCEFRYEAAHWLPKVPPGHQCGRLHGHSYHLAVKIADKVADDGFVRDFADIKDIVGVLIKQLDHYVLNDVAGLSNPTVENQLIWFWDRLKPALPVTELTLRETANNSATYRGVTT